MTEANYRQMLDDLRVRRVKIDAAIVAIEALLGARVDPPASTVRPRGSTPPKRTPKARQTRPTKASPATEEVLAALEAGETTPKGIIEVTELHRDHVFKALKTLMKDGRLTKTGHRRAVRYALLVR